MSLQVRLSKAPLGGRGTCLVYVERVEHGPDPDADEGITNGQDAHKAPIRICLPYRQASE